MRIAVFLSPCWGLDAPCTRYCKEYRWPHNPHRGCLHRSSASAAHPSTLLVSHHPQLQVQDDPRGTTVRLNSSIIHTPWMLWPFQHAGFCGTSWNQPWRQQQESLFKFLLRFSLLIQRSPVPRWVPCNFVLQQYSNNLQYGGRTIYKDPNLRWCVQVRDTAPKKVADNYNSRTEISFEAIN